MRRGRRLARRQTLGRGSWRLPGYSSSLWTWRVSSLGAIRRRHRFRRKTPSPLRPRPRMRPTPRAGAMAAPGELAFDGPSAAGRLCSVLVSLRSPLHCPAPAATRALSYALTGCPLTRTLRVRELAGDAHHRGGALRCSLTRPEPGDCPHRRLPPREKFRSRESRSAMRSRPSVKGVSLLLVILMPVAVSIPGPAV